MSAENVKAFLEKVEGDKGLQGELKALADKRKAQEDAEAEEIVKVASKAGYTFTAADLAEVHGEAVGRLSEDELRQVAGGGGDRCPYCAHGHTRYVHD